MRAGIVPYMLTAAISVSAALADLEPSPPAKGVLVAIGLDGKPIGLCPVARADSRIERLSCCVVRHEVTQTFKNSTPNPIQALYVVPLGWMMLVEDASLAVGARTVQELLDFDRPPSKATDAYMAAQQAGQLAVIEQRAREAEGCRFQLLENIQPGEEVGVKLRYVELLEPNPPWDVRIVNAEAAGELIDRVNRGEITEESIREQVQADEEAERERVRRWEEALTPEQKRCKAVDKISRELRLAAAGVDPNLLSKVFDRFRWRTPQGAPPKLVHVVNGRAYVSVYFEEFSEGALEELGRVGFERVLHNRRSKYSMGTIDLKRLEDLAQLDIIRTVAPHRANREGEEPAFEPGKIVVAYDIDRVQVCPVRAAKEGKSLVELTGNQALASLDQIHANAEFGLDLANAKKSFFDVPQTGSLIEDRRQFRERNEARRQESRARQGLPPLEPTPEAQAGPDLVDWYIVPCRVGKEEEAAAALGNDPNIRSASLSGYIRIDD